jgi:hypothetical protein
MPRAVRGIGEGAMSPGMRWKLGKEPPPRESKSPDPNFNRGD